MKKFFKISVIVILTIIVVGFLIPEKKGMPYGTKKDYNQNSFGCHPWTRGVNGSPHTGVDIFGKEGAPVVSNTGGIVIYSGYFGDISGNMVAVLGPKWRVHTYLHLQSPDAHLLQFLLPGDELGKLGKTGNARNTPAHVHYSIETPFPYFWKYNAKYGNGKQPPQFNWMKMFYLNPVEHIHEEELEEVDF